MDNQDYLTRVHEHLDARRDPLDDPDVVTFLDAHPEQLSAFADLHASLRVLAQRPPKPNTLAIPASHTGRRWHYFGIAAAAAMLVWFGYTLRALTATDTSSVQPANSHPPRILMSSLEELEPTLRPAAFYTVRDPLVHTTTFTLEAYQDRSELR